MLKCIDYPLPPNEDKTEILRVVVRESMSRDLLDRLIADICSTTESLISTAQKMQEAGGIDMDLAAWQPFAGVQSVEKQHANQGLQHGDKHHAKRPMHKGVHRTVC